MTIPGKGGRPRLYNSPEEMQPLIEKYFDEAREQKRSYTVPDLARALGFRDRNAPRAYLNNYPEFSSTIKRAMLRIEGQRNRQLVDGGNAAGKIFDLVNNFGWENPQQKFKHSGDAVAPLLPDMSKVPTDVLRQIIDLTDKYMGSGDDEKPE